MSHIICETFFLWVYPSDDIQTVRDQGSLESRAGWTWSVSTRFLEIAAVPRANPFLRRTKEDHPPSDSVFFSWDSVEYLIKTVYNWWGVCEWETLFRLGFSYNILVEFYNQFQNNIFAVCLIQIKEIEESTIQQPRIWPAFLAFILFPPVGFISFLLYKFLQQLLSHYFQQ